MRPDQRRDPRMESLRDPFPETRRDALPEGSLGSPRRRGSSSARRLEIWIGILVLVLLGAALYFGPHWTIYRMRTAIEQKDARALSSYVDFPSVRESLKVQMLVMFDRATGDTKDTPFAALGKALVVGVANTMVDALVTPAGVLAMMEEGRVKAPTTPPTESESGAGTQSSKGQRPTPESTPESTPAGEPSRQAPEYRLEYLDFSTVRIKAAEEASGAFILHRRNLIQWRLAELELPTPEPKAGGRKR
jgi:hypothetical protein